MNTEKLNLDEVIQKSGLKKNFIAAGVGISQNYLSMLINGRRNAPETIKKIFSFVENYKKAA